MFTDGLEIWFSQFAIHEALQISIHIRNRCRGIGAPSVEKGDVVGGTLAVVSRFFQHDAMFPMRIVLFVVDIE